MVSYTTFSPLPDLSPSHSVRSETVSGGHSLLPYPTVTNSFYFRKWSTLCCPDFPLAPQYGASGRAGNLLSRCKDSTKYALPKTKTIFFVILIAPLMLLTQIGYPMTAKQPSLPILAFPLCFPISFYITKIQLVETLLYLISHSSETGKNKLGTPLHFRRVVKT